MNRKNKTILSLIVVLLLLIVVFIVWQNPLNHKTNNQNQQNLYTGDLEQAQKIEITKLNKTITLEKIADKWLVTSENNAEADQTLIDKLINSLKEAQTGTIISQNPDKLVNFELTEIQATKVKISNQQNTLLEILVGKMGPAYTQSYVKKVDSNNVLLVDNNLSLSLTPTSWIKTEAKPEETSEVNSK